MNDLTIYLALALPLCTAAAGVLCWIGGRRRLRRQIRALGHDVERVMAGEYSVRFSPYREGALSALVCRVESMAARTKHLVRVLADEKAALSRSIADISHQLKTPLTALLSNLELLEAAESDDTARGRLTACIDLTERMAALVQALLDMARLESGGVVPDRQSVPLAELLGEAAAVAGRQAGRSVPISMQAPPGKSVWCDRKWLVQAFVNLLDNACRYAGEPPEVRVSVLGGDGVDIVTVTDNGPGVEPDALPHRFERFYRAPSRKGEGFGIGLSVADQIVRLHHGSLRAENTGGGMAFHVTLPHPTGIEKTEL